MGWDGVLGLAEVLGVQWNACILLCCESVKPNSLLAAFTLETQNVVPLPPDEVGWSGWNRAGRFLLVSAGTLRPHQLNP